MNEIVIFMGPPGAGKGTQAAKLCATRNLKPISTGEMLRDHVKRATPLGMQAKSIMDAGELLPDEIISGMVEDILDTQSASMRFLFDGFPRTIAQAQALDAMLASRNAKIKAAVLLDVDEDTVVERLMKRSVVEGRSDDDETTIRARLRTYHHQTEPLSDYYADQGILRRVDGMGPVEVVHQSITAQLDSPIAVQPATRARVGGGTRP